MLNLKSIAKQILFMFILYVLIKTTLDLNEGKELFNGNPVEFFGMAIPMSIFGGLGLYLINQWVKKGDN